MNETAELRNPAWTSSEFRSRKSEGTGRFLTQGRYAINNPVCRWEGEGLKWSKCLIFIAQSTSTFYLHALAGPPLSQ